MIAVIFEVEPAEGMEAEYLALAAALAQELEHIEGFISVERFRSVADTCRLVSLSFFRDEEAVRQWRNAGAHRATQGKGRAGVLADYRLRVAEVTRDYGMYARAEAPQDSRSAHDSQPSVIRADDRS
ncbi:antibiotic biosynthesis monooxygenase family protein [Sphingomonas sp. UYP23]